MGCRILRRHIWSYSVCLCPLKKYVRLYVWVKTTETTVSTKRNANFLLTKLGQKIIDCQNDSISVSLLLTAIRNFTTEFRRVMDIGLGGWGGGGVKSKINNFYPKISFKDLISPNFNLNVAFMT